MRGSSIVLSKSLRGVTSKQGRKCTKMNMKSNCLAKLVNSLDKNGDLICEKSGHEAQSLFFY